MSTDVLQTEMTAGLQQLFAGVVLPRVRHHAAVAFRDLHAVTKEEATAEAVALAWCWYVRLVRQGKDVRAFPSALATYAARQVRCGRRLCGQEPGHDVLSVVAQRRHAFRVESLPTTVRRDRDQIYSQPHGQREMDVAEERLRDNTVTPPPDQAAFRIDYPTWLAQLGDRDRQIAEQLALDHSTQELAARHGVSPGRISQLRRELYASWRRFHRDEDGPR